VPTDFVCDRCVLGPQSGQTVIYGPSLRSGARRTTVCTGRFRAITYESNAESVVDVSNKVLPHDHRSCSNVTGLG
jgi:hypothetical protein